MSHERLQLDQGTLLHEEILVVVAEDNGLLVVAGVTQDGNDNARLKPIVEAACEQEPGGVIAVDADSGYFGGDAVAELIECGSM